MRHVTVYRSSSDELGISITGGLEYGVPILISEIIPDRVVQRSGEFYVGDAILAVNGNDLRDKRHHDAAEILAAQQVPFSLSSSLLSCLSNLHFFPILLFLTTFQSVCRFVSWIGSSKKPCQNGGSVRGSITNF